MRAAFRFARKSAIRRVQTLSALLADPGLQLCFGILIDARGASSRFALGEAQVMAESHCRLSKGRVRRTALLTTGGVQYGVGRMVQAHAEYLGLEMEVFTDETRALAWLEEGLAGG
ncbi:MAG: hypothetical protein NTU91_00915 [Chloroflexi bacterium]|nr:hypothetical protein [Chloroflexota bacterium]